MLPKASLGSIIKEEISLEGLEGSTFDTLWNRIAERLGISMPLPQKLMHSVWHTVLQNPEFEFYSLSLPRKPYVWFDRLANVDADTGVPLHPAEYPGHRFKYKRIEANGIRGSCEEYDTRVPVCRAELLSTTWVELDQRYAFKFVIVASQRMRESFLITHNCTMELTSLQYCMLEWIGRSRFNGETSHGKFSLLEMTHDSSSLFYNRKVLSKAKLITRQNLSIRYEEISIQGLVFHLPRYYNEMKSKQVLLVERVVSELKRRKHFMGDYEEMKVMMLGRPDAGKLFRSPEFQRCIKTDETVAYRVIYPDAPVSAWQTKRGEEKVLRIMRLIDPNADIHDREGQDEADAKDCFLDSADSTVLYADVPLFRQAYSVIRKNGDAGTSQTELAAKLGLDRLSARGVVKILMKLKAIESQSVDEGRQRLARFFIPGGSRRSTVYQKELTQFVSNQMEVIESQRQQQSNVEVDDILQSSFMQLQPGADATFDSSAIGTETSESSAQDTIVTKVVLSDKLYLQKQKAGISQSKTKSVLMLRRCNFIVELVKQEQAIVPRAILKRLNADERKKAHKHEACSKSVIRMISRLAADRLVVIANVTMKRDEREFHFSYVCDPKITQDQSALQSKILLDKTRIALQSQASNGKTDETDRKPLPSAMVPRGYHGCLSKCLRMKLFHEFLFYMVYEQRHDAGELAINDLTTVDITGLEAHELSPIYSDTNDWRMFIPPLNATYETYGPGWVLLMDVFVRMPLGIFCSICAFAFYTTDLDYYLDHPIRRYYLVKHLPVTIRMQLLTKRRYIQAMLETIKLLCYAGLLQMGPKIAKVRDQTYVYVNRTTSLLDTTSSRPGYNEIEDREYPQLSFRFDTVTQVKEYWKKLFEVATGTQINTRSTAIGREILVQQLNFKQAMIDAVREQTSDSAPANDCHQLPPGDRRGAAGMDTAMFMHLKSNWHKLINFAPPVDRHRLKTVRKAVIVKKLSGGVGAKVSDGKRLTLKQIGGTSGGAIFSKQVQKQRGRVTRRTIKPRKTMPRRAWQEGYDEVDRRALKLMNKLRVKWTLTEDYVLLVCRVALVYLYGSTTNVFCPVNSINFRDILHWSNARSLCKTSRACQRRLNYMVTKLQGYAEQVRTMLEESKLNAQVTSRFGPGFIRKLRQRFFKQEDYMVASRIHFVQLVHLFRRIFTRQLQDQSRELLPFGRDDGSRRSREGTLPNRLDEFYRQYNVIDTSVNNVRLNYRTDPATVEELARHKLTIVIHSAMANWRTVCDERLQSILERYVESNVIGAMSLLRNFQLVSVNNWVKGNVARVVLTSASIAGEKRVYHMSITYHQQLMTSIPFELFVPLFEQLVTLFGRERYTEERYECEDGADGMVLLLSEMVAIGRVELSIDQAANYIEIRPDAMKGNSEVLSPLGHGFAEGCGTPTDGTHASTSKGTSKGEAIYGEVFSPVRGQGFLEPAAIGTKALPRKSSGKPKRTSKKASPTGSGCARLKSISFLAEKDVTLQYVMHPIERLLKLPIEYFHFFCLLEQLKLADQRLLAQTFKIEIDEPHPTTCSLTNCSIASTTSGGDVLGRCLALVSDRREQLVRIKQHYALQKTVRPSRTDLIHIFEVREENLLMFFGKYIEDFQQRAGKSRKRDINRQQQMLSLNRTAVNMAELILECLTFDEASPGYNWLDRYEMTNAVPIVDDDEEPDEGEDDRQVNEMRSGLSEKVFKLHNYYEVALMKIHVRVCMSSKQEDGLVEERETYGQWSIPREFLPEGAKQRKRILLKIASDVVWPQTDNLCPLMNEAMALIKRNLHACALLEFIEQKHQLGATVKELAVAFPNHCQLEQHLRMLQGCRLLLRAGFRSITYVHWRYADEWLTKSLIPSSSQQQRQEQDVEKDATAVDKLQGDPLEGPSTGKRKGEPLEPCEEEPRAKKGRFENMDPANGGVSEKTDVNEKPRKYIQIAMAPWIQIDGTLNKRLLYRWLCSILLYCVAHPGVPFSVLFSRFNMMCPVHLRQLLEILQDYDCVSLHSLGCRTNNTIFSVFKPAKIAPVTEFVSDEHSYVETPPNALSTLSLCIGEYRKYTQDLFDPVRRTRRETETKSELDSKSADV